MSTYCCYKDCFNAQRPFASKTFFNLPADHRRETWIKHSGNDKLQSETITGRKLFCEDHFDPKFLRRQFNRTTLRRDAVPYPFSLEVQEIEFIEIGDDDDTERDRAPDQVLDIRAEAASDEESIIERKRTASPKIVHQYRNKKSHNSISYQIDDDANQSIGIDADDQNDLSQYGADDGNDENEEIAEDNEHPHKSVDVGPQKCLQSISIDTNVCENDSKEQKHDESIKELENLLSKVDKTIASNSSTEANVSSSCNESIDTNKEDTYFALSLAGILKRLPPHKRAIAKCHILTYLTELEYGSSSLS